MDSNELPWKGVEDIAKTAFKLYENGKFKESLVQLEELIETDPINSSWLFNKGLTLDSLNRFDDAIEAFEQADILNPNDPVILNSVATDYMRTGLYGKALETFEHLQTIEPDFEPGYCRRIVLYSEMGDHEKAEEMFYLAREIVEECPVCYYNLGTSLFVRKKYDDAIRCWKKTKSIEPTHPQIDYSIGQAYWAKGDKNQAKKHIIAELRRNPDTKVFLSYSVLLLETEQLQQAEGILRFILELEPNEHAHHYLGELCLNRGNIEDAIENFQRALHTNPSVEGAHYRLSQCYIQLRQSQNARYHLLREVKAHPTDTDVLIDLGALLYEAGLRDKALHCFLRALDISPKDYRALHNISCCQYWQGRLNDGIETSKMVLEQNPRHLPSLQNLIHSHLCRGELEQAEAYVEKVKNHSPEEKTLKYLKRKISWSKAVDTIGSVFGLESAGITRSMRKTMRMEHGFSRWYPFTDIPPGKMEGSTRYNFLQLTIRKDNWRT